MQKIKPFIIANKTPKAQKLYEELSKQYKNITLQEASHIISIGGDGFMLECLRKYMNVNKPFYGINKGTVGFLTNKPSLKPLDELLTQASQNEISPLKLTATDIDNVVHHALAINEVALFRASPQTIHIKIDIQDKTRMEKLICDGIMVATPAGSTAYNLSAHGTILPIESSLLALTPISPFRPRKWHGALLPSYANTRFTLLDYKKRPAHLSADNREFKNIIACNIHLETSIIMQLLFDKEHSLEERILREQFSSY